MNTTIRCPKCRSSSVSDNHAMNMLECDDCGALWTKDGYDNNLIDEIEGTDVEDEDEDDCCGA